MTDRVVILIEIINEHFHLRMEVAAAVVIGDNCLFRTIEGQTFTLGSHTYLGDIIETEHHIL